MDALPLKQVLLHGSYLVFPFLAYLGWRLRGGAWRSWGEMTLVGLALLFVWARFIEPQLVTVAHHRVAAGFPGRVALVSDLHAGLYKGTGFFERLVRRLNALDVDVVLIAGDLTYEPDRPLKELFAPFATLRHAAYAVRGNHDSEAPGPPIEAELRSALTSAGIRLLENEFVEVAGFSLLGLGDHWAFRDDVKLLSRTGAAQRMVVLTHNPDTALRIPAGASAIVLAGHTHGGQIRIPWLYRHVIPTAGPFDRGLHELGGVKVFVTSGVGEIGLPLRFLVPPVIDVIEFH